MRVISFWCLSCKEKRQVPETEVVEEPSSSPDKKFQSVKCPVCKNVTTRIVKNEQAS